MCLDYISNGEGFYAMIILYHWQQCHLYFVLMKYILFYLLILPKIQIQHVKPVLQ